ncbi:hypothetical protein GM708_09915 [Vibrio cholerae]|nr:hypothetical protein [Vibrio cholerae]
MNIELHHTSMDAPAGALKQRAERVLIELAPYAHVALIKPATPGKTARRSAGPTPVLLIDGQPVHPSTTPTPTTTPTPGLEPKASEKTTNGVAGVPPLRADDEELETEGPGTRILTEADIRSALGQALLKAGPGVIRLPLRHRRIIAIALLLMVIGALSSQFLAYGSVLTLTGVALLPVGLATNGRRTGRQPLMVAAGCAALLGLALLFWYFAPLLLGPEESAVAPATWIYYSGLGCLTLAWLVALLAVVARRRLRRTITERLHREVSGTTTT